MWKGEKINDLSAFTDKGLRELEAWLEPWFLTRKKGSINAYAGYHARNQPVPDHPTHNWTLEWTWDGTAGQTDMFDVSDDATEPVARVSALYVITVTATPQTAVPGQFFDLTIDMNSRFGPGGEGFAADTFPLFPTTGRTSPSSPWGAVTLPWRILAGESFDAIIDQNAGAGDILFDAYASIIRLAIA